MIIISFRSFLRNIILSLVSVIHRFYGYDISSSAKISFGAILDKTNPKGIHIGDESYLANGARILTHDFCRAIHADVTIGKRCFIGADSLILPGVTLKDCTIVGAGAVVTKSPQCGGVILAGNPARIIKKGIVTSKYGQIQK